MRGEGMGQGPACVCFLVGFSVSESPQRSRLVDSVGRPVEFLSPLLWRPQSFPPFFYKTSLQDTEYSGEFHLRALLCPLSSGPTYLFLSLTRKAGSLPPDIGFYLKQFYPLALLISLSAVCLGLFVFFLKRVSCISDWPETYSRVVEPHNPKPGDKGLTPPFSVFRCLLSFRKVFYS